MEISKIKYTIMLFHVLFCFFSLKLKMIFISQTNEFQVFICEYVN